MLYYHCYVPMRIQINSNSINSHTVVRELFCGLFLFVGGGGRGLLIFYFCFGFFLIVNIILGVGNKLRSQNCGENFTKNEDYSCGGIWSSRHMEKLQCLKN